MSAVSVLDLSNYFSITQPSLLQIRCSKKPDLTQYGEKYVQTDSFVLLLFENGPLAMIRMLGGNGLKGDVHTSGFTADVLIHQYLNLHNVEKAINVLLCLNWDTYGSMLALSLHKIANYIFKQPFQPERELQLQKALGSFHIPVKPLCGETVVEFGDQVRDITRKFFQYLLRYKSYEKAFNLAIDIDDEDLFMDLHNSAKADGQEDLAEDAFRKAEEILTRPDSSTRKSRIGLLVSSVIFTFSFYFLFISFSQIQRVRVTRAPYANHIHRPMMNRKNLGPATNPTPNQTTKPKSKQSISQWQKRSPSNQWQC